MSDNQLMVAMPSFKFRVKESSIEGYIHADNIDEAVKLLERIHLGPKRIIDIDGNSLVKGAEIVISPDGYDKPIQIAYVEKEEIR